MVAFPKISDIEARDGKPVTVSAIVPLWSLWKHLKCAYNLPHSVPYSIILGIFHVIRIWFLYTGF